MSKDLWSKIGHRYILAMFNKNKKGGGNRPRSISWVTVHNQMRDHYKINDKKIVLIENENDNENNELALPTNPIPCLLIAPNCYEDNLSVKRKKITLHQSQQNADALLIIIEKHRKNQRHKIWMIL